MQDRDLIISQIRQRLEILYQMIEELEGGGGEPGTTDYNDLSNKPSINNVTLTGNKTTTQLGLASATQINQTNTNVTNLSTEVDDIFTPDNITLNEGGFFPQVAMDWIQLHRPISVNNDIYYCIEETGVDYLYASIPTNGAFPSTSYLRIMKSNRKVEFHNTIIETTPTANSNNLVTSGGIKTALNSKANQSAFDILETEVATKTTLAGVYGIGTPITINSDLNDYMTPGGYQCATTSISATLTNSPISGTNTFRMEVKTLNANNRLMQIVYPLSGSDIFMRKYTSAGWQPWNKLTWEVVS